MASLCLCCFVLFSHLVLIFSAGHGNRDPDNCPRSFSCGKLGSFRYPFTKAELPDCGLLLIHDCGNATSYPKKIQLEKNGRSLDLTGVAQQNKIISIFDQDFHSRLEQNCCHTLKNNYGVPSPSPLVSFYIKYNVTLFRCNHRLNIKAPANYFKKECPDSGYDVFYYKNYGSPNKEEAGSNFSDCSVVQLPSKDVSDTQDILSFVSAQMVLEVVLSHNCDECCNHRGGQCRLDTSDKFYCDKGLGISTLLGILIVGCFFRRCCRGKRAPSALQYQSKSTNTNVNDPYTNPDPESGRDYFGVPLFSYNELKEATNNFHHTTQLANGGFGAVYYGKLRDGREVAVKRLYEHNYRRVEQFMNEIEILTCMRHKNLVSLYGCTSRHSHELLLVYEYVPNGTVAFHLHGEMARTATLPWHIRMKIAIETASSLSYLHASDIIHRDVKTDNILLDNNFCVKVADFGLSRLFPNDVTHVSTAPQGTPGYLDPEYYRCYQLTSKSDVYSFGVVLIELISSKPAVDMNRHKDEINLSDLAIKKIRNSALSELVDPSLGFDSDIEVKRMIASVAELAFQCLQRDRDLRPSMVEVLKVLITIEGGKDKAEHAEEVDVHPPSSPPSPDLDEIGLLKNVMLLPSPKAVTDRWNSESTTPSVSC